MYRTEARIDEAGNILVAPPTLRGHDLIRDFFGATISPEELATADLAGRTVYLCGDLSGIDGRHLESAARVFVIGELSQGLEQPWPVVDGGRVPVRVHGAGVYYRRFFDLDADHFGRIRAEHAFQSLTESDKPGTARRSGIYLTPVTQDGDALHFRLLRCSTNLSGPTEGFRATDTEIVDALNREAASVFRDHAPLNHVLAQIYHNTHATAERKQSKAKISAHADKTKDMPGNGIMAFCTFYDGLDKLRPMADDPFDHGLKRASGLTRLHFRLKEEADGLPPQFSLTLYPGSVFFMPLSTNRLYTHEIRPSTLNAEALPTRLGYVVRCSSAEAVHRNGQTFLKRAGDPVELGPPTPEGMDELRRLYAEENRTSSFIDYGDQFLFSMNSGDYVAPRA
ncbi:MULTISPECIES: hypothetical protein [Streptomyces]|uniref:hypothetical protein n=1 Tax=Streptomyces TaxID=1883 RepID=UPI00099066BC|nr:MULTISPECIES: hypothetical protein [unclassified Streptomyces]AQT73770.1 hypothetical protein B1K54_20925 [Streptomyces sp. fd1-xmd]MDX6759258.1 hypothetical protein [Streptomyces sp. F8]